MTPALGSAGSVSASHASCTPSRSSGARDVRPHGSARDIAYIVSMLVRTSAQHIGLVVALACATASLAHARPPREVELETRLFAPCCYVQTLDVHESELADKLRSEIHVRIERGEAAAAIEEDLVRRFGEKIRAVPAGSDPRSWIPLLVGAGLALVLGALVLIGLRWTRPRRSQVLSPELAREEAKHYDAVLDRELAEQPHGDAA